MKCVVIRLYMCRFPAPFVQNFEKRFFHEGHEEHEGGKESAISPSCSSCSSWRIAFRLAFSRRERYSSAAFIMEKLSMYTKPSRIACALLFLWPTLASAQLRFTNPTVDLGELRGGPIYHQRFDFVNDSAKPIEITDFRLGCGCLQPVLEKRIYQPRENGTLLMNVRPLGQRSGA